MKREDAVRRRDEKVKVTRKGVPGSSVRGPFMLGRKKRFGLRNTGSKAKSLGKGQEVHASLRDWVEKRVNRGEGAWYIPEKQIIKENQNTRRRTSERGGVPAENKQRRT